MTTTNLFVIANIKQLRTGGSFKILLPFIRTFRVLVSEIQRFLTVFSVGLSLAGFWRAFRISGGGRHPKTPPQYSTVLKVFLN